MDDEYKLELYRNLPGYANLTDEQKVTADRWDRERQVREKLYTELSAAEKAKDNEAFKKVLDRLAHSEETNAWMCEHERHWSSTCMACEEVEKILRPELYCRGNDCGYPLEEEEIEKGIQICECCREKDDAI
jgi:hypothetical protein